MTTRKEDPLIGLYREAFPDFAGMVRRMGGTLDQAKDSFHDALLIYIEKEKAGRLRLLSSPKAYVIGTARICWLRTLESAYVPEIRLEGELSEEEDKDPLYSEEMEKGLLESLVKSGKKCLELLRAFYYDRISMREIAGRFGFNGGRSATVQKYKCLEKVRKEMKATRLYAK